MIELLSLILTTTALTPVESAKSEPNPFSFSPSILNQVMRSEWDKCNLTIGKISKYYLERPAVFSRDAVSYIESAMGKTKLDKEVESTSRRFQVYIVWEALQNKSFLSIVSDKVDLHTDSRRASAFKRWYIMKVVDAVISGEDIKLYKNLRKENG